MLIPQFEQLLNLRGVKMRGGAVSRSAVASLTSGNYHSPFRGQGLEFDTVREYVPGDDIRNLDWKVTARRGVPYLKVFKEDREKSAIICVDMNERMRFGTRNTFKSVQAATVAALLGWRELALSHRVGACLFGDVAEGVQYFTPKRTRSSQWAMLRELSQPPEESHRVSLETILERLVRAAHTGSLLYLISDFLDLEGELSTLLAHLSRTRDLILIAVNDPADMRIPPVGDLTLAKGLGQKLLVNTASVAGREAYAAMWRENRALLARLTRNSHSSLIELTTESEIIRELPLALKRVACRSRYGRAT